MTFNKFLLVCVIFLIYLVTISSTRRLEGCINSGKGIVDDIPVEEKWFKWGQFYAYCMNYNATSTPTPFDSECSTNTCKECMTACNQDTFKLENCSQSCGTSQPCKDGCSYYDRILNNTVYISNVTLQQNFRNKTVYVKENLSDVEFKWNKTVLNVGSKKSTGVYLVTLSQRTVNRRHGGEDVLFLTSDLYTNLTVKKMCENIKPLSLRPDDAIFRLNVYPIYEIGYINSSMIHSSYRIKSVPSVLGVIYNEDEPYYKNKEIHWDFQPLWSQGTTYIHMTATWKSSTCSMSYQPWTSGTTLMFNKRKVNETLPLKRAFIPADRMQNCIQEIKITPYTICYPGLEWKTNLTYHNCTTVKDHPQPCPYVPTTTTTTTTPTPPQLEYDLNLSEFNCTDIKTPLPDNKTVCVDGSFTALISWKGSSLFPILFYRLKWGDIDFFGTPNYVKKDLIINDTETSPYSFGKFQHSSKDKVLGVKLFAETKYNKYNTFNKLNKNFVTYDISKMSAKSQFVEISQSEERERADNCHEVTKIPCVGNDTSTLCEKCINGSYNIILEWEPKAEFVNSTFHVRWGRAVEMDGQSFVPSNLQLGSAITTESEYIITGLKRKYLKLGIQVYAQAADGKSLVPLLSPDYVYNYGPNFSPLPKPTTASPTVTTTALPTVTKPTTKSSQTAVWITLGIIIPLLLLAVLLLVFYICRRRRGPSLPPVWIDGKPGFESYLEQPILQDKWEIMPTDINLEQKIGEGAFGTVYSATISAVVIRNTNYAKQLDGPQGFGEHHKIAVKFLKEGASTGEKADFLEEIKLMKNIGYHKNIVNLIGCSTVKQPNCLAVEFMEYGDLLQYLRKRRSRLCTKADSGTGTKFLYTETFQDSLQTTITSVGSNSEFLPPSEIYDNTGFDSDDVLTPDELLGFAWQICSGMEYLADKNMVHRDLAARNVLIGANKIAKVSDFGLTRKVGNDQIYMSQTQRKLPIKWMSVEAIFDQEFTHYSDVWAYGVTLFEIVTLGGTPYPTTNNRELLGLLKSGYRMEKPENCSEPMYEIMLHCWMEKPLERPTFSSLRNHLEGIMSDGDRYMSFNIDEENTYYNVASFKSVPSDTEDDDVEEAFKPPKIKSVDELKKEEQLKQQPEENNDEKTIENKVTIDNEDDIMVDGKDVEPAEEVIIDNTNARYVTPQSLKTQEMNKLNLHKNNPSSYINIGMDRSDVVL